MQSKHYIIISVYKEIEHFPRVGKKEIEKAKFF